MAIRDRQRRGKFDKQLRSVSEISDDHPAPMAMTVITLVAMTTVCIVSVASAIGMVMPMVVDGSARSQA
jgi:hypothetical protein|nr:hypothetical protein [Henriciella sp.]|tara:strand:- start:2271 stop:2477 length:207 start_codon:yes stop_codon:yes gene_type:complete